MSSAFKFHRIVEFINDPKLLAKGENHFDIHLNNDIIDFAKCTCAIGQSKCIHMTALLLHAYKNISVTDKECAWRKQKSNDDDKICTIDDLYPDKNNSVIKKINCDIKQMCFEKLKSKRCPTIHHFIFLLDLNKSFKIMREILQ
ncbi:hypothetical protein QTP88_016078 [Uroleucon formosanum]